jgi:hypothetical protein
MEDQEGVLNSLSKVREKSGHNIIVSLIYIPPLSLSKLLTFFFFFPLFFSRKENGSIP